MSTRLSSPTSLIYIALALAAAGSPIASAQDDDGDDAIMASCVLRISYGAPLQSLDQATVRGVLESPAVLGEAWKEACGDGADRRKSGFLLEFEETSSTEPDDGDDDLGSRGLFVGVLRIGLSGADNASRCEKLLAAMVRRLEPAIVKACEPEMAELAQRVQAADQRVGEAQKRLDELMSYRVAVAKSTGRGDLSSESVRNEMRELQTAQRELHLERVGREARHRAITEQIKSISERSVASAAGSAMVVEAEEVLKLRETQLNRTKTLVENGQAPDSELTEALERLSDARVRLLRAREDAASAQGGDMLESLNSELAQLSIAAAETEARAGEVARLLNLISAGSLLALADEYERKVTIDGELIRDEYRRASQTQAALARRMQDARPLRVIAIGVPAEPTK